MGVRLRISIHIGIMKINNGHEEKSSFPAAEYADGDHIIKSIVAKPSRVKSEHNGLLSRVPIRFLAHHRVNPN